MEPKLPFLRACLSLPVTRTPIWIMRQAGRYLPEYRALRARAGDFLTLCRTPELALQATMQPLERFPLDAAILFSDILVVPEAMGQTLTFTTGDGPLLEPAIRSEQEFALLSRPDPTKKLDYVLAAVALIRRTLDGGLPLIGFSGSPWTLATYMVEGGSSKDFAAIKTMVYRQPELLTKLLAMLSDTVADYLNAQIRHGAQAVQIFDTWGGVLAAREFHHFSLNPIRRIIDQLDRTGPDGQPVPIILFAKGCGQFLDDLADTGCHVLGLDWTTDIGRARRLLDNRTAIQGNLDPAVLYAAPDRIQSEAAAIIHGYGPYPGHIFNLGHGIPQDVNPEHVRILVDAVHTTGEACFGEHQA